MPIEKVLLFLEVKKNSIIYQKKENVLTILDNLKRIKMNGTSFKFLVIRLKEEEIIHQQ